MSSLHEQRKMVKLVLFFVAGQVGSLIPHLVDGGVSIVQYVDDTILFFRT